ncbi:hypothetical protein CF66_7022 [Candidatus Photodesmus katoptron]|uniref:Pyridoxal phosphate homeostasis protein n=1 Tax=Candidatus Photodesmus katoptron Akat1 TaxID=1236703 RepID=S3DHV3_9GAMM|nr:YggS family pyridoxal phosphate-dependent enzyme [Candidatus Photodesmus katoptron]EPE37260.1 UPF0001 protein PA0394 [Candidatus Photodesmus katoptron Akat1]KEY90083.1 hypothetical protein CF66_7022 [Candidatus Photodesmus katoptron]
MVNIKKNIQNITSNIQSAQKKFGRSQNSVQLLAASKSRTINEILDAIRAGQRIFGESYVQEGVDKIVFFQKKYLKLSLEWHFIGNIQSNKTNQVSKNFDWVHTISRSKIAQRLNDQRPKGMKPIQVLIQVNTSNERNKFGVTDTEIFPLAKLISSLPNLKLRGLMSIPHNKSEYQSQFSSFLKLVNLKKKLNLKYPFLDTLSMGMSNDMHAAIAAGSTIVRIGTAIFGIRNYD